jgi:CheY-like chemotaxis protein
MTSVDSRHVPLVLVVEDDPMIRLVVRMALEEELGVRVLVARNGAEALAVLASGSAPALILSDVRMPVLSGIELAAALKADSVLRSIPLVVMAASVEMRNAALRAGADDHLDKPFDLSDLLATASKYLEMRAEPEPSPPQPSRESAQRSPAETTTNTPSIAA